jgi:hypothetical protein
MARRKITEEAETNQEQTEEDDQDTADQGSDRTQLTQRMPNDILEDVDELAETMGMSRNAAINMLVKRGLDGF